jgi:hypothetical protein
MHQEATVPIQDVHQVVPYRLPSSGLASDSKWPRARSAASESRRRPAPSFAVSVASGVLITLLGAAFSKRRTTFSFRANFLSFVHEQYTHHLSQSLNHHCVYHLSRWTSILVFLEHRRRIRKRIAPRRQCVRYVPSVAVNPSECTVRSNRIAKGA